MKGDPLKTIRARAGFSLLELMATIAVISIGLGSLYAVMFRGLNHMRIVGSKNYAVVAATSEIEIIRAMSEEKLPESYTGPFMGDIDLSALTDGKGVLKIEDYEDSKGGLKRVTATVQWNVVGRRKTVSVLTLVGRP